MRQPSDNTRYYELLDVGDHVTAPAVDSPTASPPTDSPPSSDDDYHRYSDGDETPPDSPTTTPPGILTRVPNDTRGDLDNCSVYILSRVYGGGSGDSAHDYAELNCIARTTKRMRDAYGVFAFSTVGLVVRAFAKSVPQCLILSGASSYATAGLITPLVFEKASSDQQIRNYFFYYGLVDAFILLCSLAYDTTKRLKGYYNIRENYDSFGVFRLRAACMGAALGGLLMSNLMDEAVSNDNPWLKFAVTLPATAFPAYLRYRYFKHEIVPSPLGSNETAVIAPRERRLIRMDQQRLSEEKMIAGHKKDIFNNPVFNSVAGGFSAMGAALLMYRVIQAIPYHDTKKFTTVKILCATLPFVFGSAISASKKFLPAVNYRWKQLEIVSGDSAMLYLSVANFFISLNFFERPRYFTQSAMYSLLFSSILVACTQAARLLKSEPETNLKLANYNQGHFHRTQLSH